MNNTPVTMISAPDNASQTGAAIFTGQAFSGCFTSTFGDATAAGTIKIQGSNSNFSPYYKNPLAYTPPDNTFNDIPSATATVASGVAPAIVIPQLHFQYIRAVFTRSGGGTTTITVLGSIGAA